MTSLNHPTKSPTENRIILGIDPGLNTTGYGVIEFDHPNSGIGRGKIIEAGIIKSKATATIENKVTEIYSGVNDLIHQYTPNLVALEQLFSHYERPRTAILMGHARGVICLAAGQAGIEVAHYEPTRVKMQPQAICMDQCMVHGETAQSAQSVGIAPSSEQSPCSIATCFCRTRGKLVDDIGCR